ncbi:MAG: DUF3866 family protein [Firmicutes bacterium]|nr:DUF3866 family protein [Bacillota bacterium]
MFQYEEGSVQRITREGDDFQEVVVLIEGEEAKAFSYPHLTGRVQPGERVWLNTTAVRLGLGTGGYHFVMAKCDRKQEKGEQPGHIMKLRYTPWQFPVLAVEEEASPHHSTVNSFTSLEGIPVLVGTLHSMVVPALLAFHGYSPRRRVVYIMTDGAALPLSFSDTVRRLKAKGLFAATITCGHAFGGDLEAVNIYSALAAAKTVAGAELIIVTMGPGIVGTGTKYGFSGIEQAYILEAVQRLGGYPIAIPRISFADSRARHRGISHHSRTALGELTFATALIALPDWKDERMEILARQIEESGLAKHHLYQLEVPALSALMDAYDLPVKTMGRSYHEDPAFFETAAVAGVLALNLLGGELGNLRNWGREEG